MRKGIRYVQKMYVYDDSGRMKLNRSGIGISYPFRNVALGKKLLPLEIVI